MGKEATTRGQEWGERARPLNALSSLRPQGPVHRKGTVMRCHCCGLGVPCSRKVKIRPLPDYDPSQVGRGYTVHPAYVMAMTFHWSFICQTCYSVLDNEWGVDVITGQGFNLAGTSRGS